MTIAIAIIVALFMVYCCNMLWSIHDMMQRQQQEYLAFYRSLLKLMENAKDILITQQQKDNA